ncbi:uncharacterized protein LOC131688986 [Topomyia yanbarensis]|uniref:uncharacterized protein LOC131688986 n=1 Tax=Topomyia yanbarensis TaxID=2498891 RepID=UPI00273C3EFA|nr:uncharacterized protein LOC131688986 [Topomyia yanbarensis]
MPFLKLPPTSIKIRIQSGCCIIGCHSKRIGNMEKFPQRKTASFGKWSELLGITTEEATNLPLYICRRHFATTDYVTVRSRYLKMNAIPSQNIVRMIKMPYMDRRKVRDLPTLAYLTDHSYCKEDLKPRSNRCCFVPGCSIKSSKGIFLHKFPENKTIAEAWRHAIKSVHKPTQNSFICSQHFHQSDYVSGRNLLKNGAVPCRNLPSTLLEKTQSARSSNNPYLRAFRSFRNPKPTCPYRALDSISDEEVNPVITAQTMSNKSNDDSAATKEDSCRDFPTDTYNNEGCEEKVSFLSELPFYETTERIDQNNNVTDCTNTAEQIDIDRTIRELQQKRKIILSDLLVTDKDLNVWTGMPSMCILEIVCTTVKNLEDNVYKNKYKMHTTDRIILTLSKLKQNVSFAALAALFRISPTTASYYFSYTIQILSEVFSPMIYWPTMEEIRRNMPHCFKQKFGNVRCVLDCTEVGIGCPNCLNCRIACYSNYKHKRTAKFLIGVTPAGLISFCSRAYSGKASDKYIFNNEKFMEKLTRYQDERLRVRVG